MRTEACRNFPDFFIIGAPKCGTTSVYDFLRAHPAAFMPKFKEPQYFCSDLTEVQQIKTESRYLSLFNRAKRDQIIGEASVWYLYSKAAVQAILVKNPNAKFIVVLRDPLKAVISFHNNSVISLVEKHEDFAEAWGEHKRNAGTPMTDYSGVYKFAEQLERLYMLVPKQQVKIVLLEQLKANPEDHYNSITDFIGLPRRAVIDYPHMNAARQWDNQMVRRYLINPQPSVRAAMQLFKRTFNALGIKPLIALQWLFTTAGENKPLADSFRQILKCEFAQDVSRLKKEFGLSIGKLWPEY